MNTGLSDQQKVCCPLQIMVDSLKIARRKNSEGTRVITHTAVAHMDHSPTPHPLLLPAIATFVCSVHFWIPISNYM